MYLGAKRRYNINTLPFLSIPFPMQIGNFEGKKGRPIGRRSPDCTVPIGLRQTLSCASAVGFFLLGTRRSHYEARGANCLKMNALR